jgi:hypothetical protein
MGRSADNAWRCGWWIAAMLLHPGLAAGQVGSFDWSKAGLLADGIDHARLTLSSPDRLKINCLRIDTLTPGLVFQTTPRASSWQLGGTETIRQTTPGFLAASQATAIPLVAAVNANLYTTAGSGANLTGFAVSGGLLVSDGVDSGVGKASFSVTRDGIPAVVTTVGAMTPGDSLTAVSGIYQCLADGVPRLSGTDRQPRTGVGVSADTRYVYLMTIDGRSSSSVGATNTEVGEWLAHFGAADGLYMDGGGSTTMAWWNPAASGSNKAEVLNTPSDGSPRSVGNNLGVGFQTPVYVPGELWWAGDGVRGGSGTWSPAAVRWREGAIYGTDVAWDAEPEAGRTAVFAGPAGTVLPTGGVRVERLDFRTSGYSLGTPTTPSEITLTGSSAVTIPAGGVILLASRLTGEAPSLSGGGAEESRLILRPTGGSTISGSTTVSGRLLVELEHAAALGTASVRVTAGSGLDFKADSGTFTNDLALAGGGPARTGATLRFSNSGRLTGRLALETDARVQLGDLFSVTATFAGEIEGEGALSLSGIGTSRAVFSGRSTYAGGTLADLGAGGIRLGSSSVLADDRIVSGPLGTGGLTLRSGVLSAADPVTPRLLANDVTIAGPATLGDPAVAPLTLAGRLTIAGNHGLDIAGDVTASGGIVADTPGSGGVSIGPGASLRLPAGGPLDIGRLTIAGGTFEGPRLTIQTGGSGIDEVILEGGAIRGSPLIEVAGGGLLQLPAAAAPRVEAAGLAVATGAAGGLVDLGSGGIEIEAGGMSLAALLQAIFAGRAGGSWDGTTGITSSLAAAGGSREIGYVAGSDGRLAVAFAAPGDTDLDGRVDAFDLVRIASSDTYGTGRPAFWAAGDFNYDGLSTILDLIAIETAGVYGSGTYLPSPPVAAAAVPEPLPPTAVVIILGLAGWRRIRPRRGIARGG